MQGKRSEYADWIMTYLEEQGEDTSNWDSYHVIYLRYAGRVKKFHPENYEQFVNLCTFSKLTKKGCGARDLGETKPKERPFNEEKWWKDEKKEWEEYKARMQRYREDRIHNQEKICKMKDLPPYIFKFGLRCLKGVYPIECYPEQLNEYKEELMKLIFTN